MNWAEFVKWLDGYPKMNTSKAEQESYAKVEEWNRNMHHGSNYKEGETVVITAVPFYVEGTTEAYAKEGLISEVVNAIGDGSNYLVFIRLMPECGKYENDDKWVAHARIAYKLKPELGAP